jgi:thioredoxin 1
MENLTDLTFNSFIESKKEQLMVVDFWAEWCGPCKALSPVLQELSTEYEDKVMFVKLEFDQCADLSEYYKIKALPTIVFLKNGKEIERMTGFKTKSVLKEKIDSLLK